MHYLLMAEGKFWAQLFLANSLSWRFYSFLSDLGCTPYPSSINLSLYTLWTLSSFLLMQKNKHVFNLHYKLNIYYYKLQKTEESFRRSNLPCHMYHLFQISFQKSILLQDRYATKSLDQLEIFPKNLGYCTFFSSSIIPVVKKFNYFTCFPESTAILYHRVSQYAKSRWHQFWYIVNLENISLNIWDTDFREVT